MGQWEIHRNNKPFQKQTTLNGEPPIMNGDTPEFVGDWWGFRVGVMACGVRRDWLQGKVACTISIL